MTTLSKMLFWSFCIGLFVGSCQRNELQVQEVYHMLSVGDVVLVTRGDWSSKSSDSSSVERSAEPASVDLGDGLSLTADEGWIGDLTHADLSDSTMAEQHVDFVSKGTPITNASGVNSFRIQLFNSGSAAWGAGVPLTESFTATKGGSSYSLSSSYNWLSDTDKVSLFAFTPVPSADNGLSVEANGYTVQYVVPTDVTKQPDFSSALAQTNVINTDGKQHMRNFNFDHRLAAVGVAIHGWNVKVTKVEVSGVSFGGKYDLSSGAWVLDAASGSRTMGVNSGQVPTDGYQGGGKTWTEVTNANGYMMMVPQALASGAKLEVTYEGVNGNADKGTITANINGLTGGVWRAGGKVMYNIQLKMAPSTSGTTLTMPWKAGYTTTGPVVFGTHDPADRYTFSWGEGWNNIHSGAAKVGDVGGGGVSGSVIAATDITAAKPLWFFANTDNESVSANRTSMVTVSGRRTAAKSFTVVQTFKPLLTISHTAPGETVPGGGKSYTVKVVSNYPWQAASGDGVVTVSPTSGAGTTGPNVVVAVPANNGTASRSVVASFKTTNDGGGAALVESKLWSGVQAVNWSVDKRIPGEEIPGSGKEYTVQVTGGSLWTTVAGTGVTVSPASGTGAGAVKITVSANPNGLARREAKVDFKVGSAVLATWSGTQGMGFVIDKTGPGETIPGGGKSYVVNIASGVAWTMVASTGTTVVFETLQGLATARLRITVAANPSGTATRAAKVEFKVGSAVMATWSGTQAVGLALDKTGPDEVIPGSGKEYTVKVAGGSAWTTVAGTGVTVSPASGTGAATVKITVSANPNGTATREAKVEFKVGSDVMATWSGTQGGGGVQVGNLSWATGNLVASGSNSCKIGAPTDYGVYFQFGSLVGWSGGANGNGVGTGQPALAVQVKPTTYSGTTVWSTVGYYKDGTTNDTGYGLPKTDAPATGIGDPCRYYLGAPWRTPTAAEYLTLLGASGANTNKGVPLKLTSYALSFPASGYRHRSDGAFNSVGSDGSYWCSSVFNAAYGYLMYSLSDNVYPQYNDYRSYGYPVRCVALAP